MTARRLGLGLVMALALVAALAIPAVAQEPSSTSPTAEVPSQDIVPQPNSGAAPEEAGDRGGALQLAVLALVLVAIGGAMFWLVRQSRQARADR